MFTRLEIFFFKQKTAYEMRISDWSSDVCSSDLRQRGGGTGDHRLIGHRLRLLHLSRTYDHRGAGAAARDSGRAADTRRAADDGDDPVLQHRGWSVQAVDRRAKRTPLAG